MGDVFEVQARVRIEFAKRIGMGDLLEARVRRRAGVTKLRPFFLSNSGMENQPNDLAARVTELEIKSSYAEDLLDQLNMTVYRQQQQIDRLILQVRQLREQSQNAAQEGAARSPRDELPPHY